MSNCIIVKRVAHRDYSYSFNIDGGLPKPLRRWYAICPHCKEAIKGGDYSTANTRKTTKDALYRHIRARHS